MTPATLLLALGDVQKLLTLDDCIAAVGRAFARQAAREDPPAALLGVHVGRGRAGRPSRASWRCSTRAMDASWPSWIRSRSPFYGVDVRPADDLVAAVRQSDICVTCTPARRAVIGPADVRPGTFIAAVGADSEDKQELAPELLCAARVVVDNLEQCATIGELHHALTLGLVTRESVHAELGELIAGTATGRRSRDEITIFDSTGTAVQDVAPAALVYERARAHGSVPSLDLAS